MLRLSFKLSMLSMVSIVSLVALQTCSVLSAAETYTIPKEWVGTKAGSTDGNPALVSGQPRWRLDQIFPANPEDGTAYQTLVWDGKQWFNQPGSQGGQPAITITDGNLMQGVRARGGGEVDYVKGAALVFIAPKTGRYAFSATVDVWRWEGGTTTQLRTLKRFKKGTSWSVEPLSTTPLKPEKGNQISGLEVTLQATEELAIIPWHDGHWSGANVTFQAPTITLLAEGAAATAKLPAAIAAEKPAGSVAGRPFPANAGLVDVKVMYGAKGDGVTDDTAAIQKAITDHCAKARVIYLPAGTYLVSDTLTYGDNLERAKFLTIQGQGRDHTIIKLKDRCAGYDQRKAVLTLFEGKTTGMAFNNCVYDLTIDVGVGNPGAVALEYMTNNLGSCERLTLRSSDPAGLGATGFDLSRHEPGPGLIRDIVIEGFDYGVMSSQTCFSMTFENLTLRKQRKAGISNNTQSLFIRKMHSENSVPAIVFADKTPYGDLSVYDSECIGSGAEAAAGGAIVAGKPMVNLRNVKQRGYAKLIDYTPADLKDLDGRECVGDYWYRAGKFSAFEGAVAKTLNLPIEETPEIAWDPLERWAVVNPERLKADFDDAPAIQEALDWAVKNGKSTVIIPGGNPVKFGSTIKVPAKIRRIIGLDAFSSIAPDLAKSTASVWKVADGTEPLLIERFANEDYANLNSVKNCYWVEHASKRPLILARGMYACIPYKGVSGSKGAKVWIDDICSSGWIFTGQQVWMRQYNPENDGIMTINDGASLWVFGTKTECAVGTWFDTRNGGKTEILGGYSYPSWRNENTPAPKPLFVVDGTSSLSANFHEQTFQGYQCYPVLVRHTRDGVTKDLSRDAFTDNGWVPIVVANPGK